MRDLFKACKDRAVDFKGLKMREIGMSAIEVGGFQTRISILEVSEAGMTQIIKCVAQ